MQSQSRYYGAMLQESAEANGRWENIVGSNMRSPWSLQIGLPPTSPTSPTSVDLEWLTSRALIVLR